MHRRCDCYEQPSNGRITEAARTSSSEARSDDARARIEQLKADAAAALSRADAEAARVAIASLDRLRAELTRTYQLRVVSREGEQSGIYRIPNVNTGARNYYVVVEVIGPDGKLLSTPVRNEENGQTKTVSKWALRVPQSTYEAVRRDKLDDGILQRNVVGEKPRGFLEPTYSMAVSGAAITGW